MTRSKFTIPLFMLSVLLSGSLICRPAAAARPLPADEDDGRWVEQTTAGTGLVMVVQSVWRPWHKLLPLEMKQAGPSCSTWDPNNLCPPPAPRRP
ncbi:hypothetical protein BDA96_10G124400 [Sorghum bicolor]|uniref:Uncharacterized protein n=2 Tax=Sorghum bicolor TaxID=4558 RepID=A0A921Q4M9_SORBI|nr:hypothetical protein BDA96_10G124400 [Sorghum bicolor]OQU76163.1 hypothetical protein SORBI_3010G102050 [Sorghum bicolor]